MFCPKCGSKMPEGSRFCGKCGAQIGPAQSWAAAGAPAAYGVPGAQGAPAAGARRSNKGLVIGIVAAVAAVAVIGVVIFGVTSFLGGDDAHSSAEGIVESVESSINQLIDNGLTDDASNTFVNELIDLMPSEVVEKMLAGQDTTRDEFVESFASYISDDSSQMDSVRDMVDFSVDASLGDSLDDGSISSLNSVFESGGLSLEITAGYELDLTLVATLKQDYSGIAAGTTEMEDYSGLAAVVQIDGSWFLFAFLNG